ncbi:3-hydroxyisobutyrate dehydrogenase-like beta-hydroxyacid dehydrogenase [Thalassospira sp. MBR-102]|jgi:3-hydroxyisobutyrate dehydrogenase-like beta-hydroxyacid dehydrogenase|uniref:2-hydroxy-3-oxopropionate reductase n=2 Tax=Thalassospira xiamenensis TaxID=220697 RepID=A0ABR5Y2P2_9PROT|nr:2-hydroxy-3-oxopropionate reductase [Thalassospira xiamenensis M-5 = DSM 17429]KZD04539.1 2-hydroxy-3-oxopropionate reductase [Thalassospira xiamenensis]MAL30510.1 NAD(P)-dependent oxidoreductase [Thalassospira sp.]MBR9781506.1 NAD(P)-dependent oxidoreductase [Rhodospirillales bacterium]OCK07888.1 2-hydroxy-3-oxopropionate reductase [Thalassospira sp. KO164]PXX32841.1 3-hydroxyisobutyrate dehydrogenase-like beta-hydroxyacid dehydrogenase [Thalassospira sp. 11-3]QPL36528.1 NAD(P)-dependent |tara:strand:+ start:267 stop:1151 length:885 start_codon:yes stop_codon:yes gene_type:complete
MTALAGENIAFIGLGLMGRPMALNLEKAGAILTVNTRNPETLNAFDDLGVATAPTPADAAANADIVIICVANTEALENVLLGEDGVIDGMEEGTIVVDMGTTAIDATRRFADAVEEAGGHWIDAPVSGGTHGAENGTLTIMVGAEEEDFQRVQRVFGVLGSRVTHVGEIGSGQIAKAANQMIVGITIGAIAEAFSMADEAGVDLGKLRSALTGGFADSAILQKHGERMIERNFEPGGKVVTQRKDLYQALEFSEGELGLELPFSRLALELYEELIEMGGGDLDHSALIKIYEEE